MYEGILARKDRPISIRLLSAILAVAIVLSCVIVAIPSFSLKAFSADASTKGTLEFKDADIDYDSNLVANSDGTYTLTLDFSSSVTRADQNVSRTVSGDGYYVAPMSGYYTIQLWGGDGGVGSDTTFNRGGKGGKGGYVYTAVKLEKGDIIAYRLGGNGTRTLKTEEGGGVNGDGGNHGEYGSYYIGGGGGYSVAYLYKNGKAADDFIKNFTSDGEILPITDANRGIYEDERMDASKYILVAGGGGGGGAGDRLNAQQVLDLILNKPNGNADGGAGGTMASTQYETKNGIIFAGQDGSSSGKKTAYIGRGGTDVPGVAPEGRWEIIDADDPNDWNKTILPDAEGGTGSSGNLRGGGGGAGYTGGSGGLMTSLVNSTNVGGGGGGSSYITTTNSYVVGLDGAKLTAAEQAAIASATNPRDVNSDGTQGGYVKIDLLNKDTDNTSITWIDEELKLDATISKYFTVATKSTENATVTLSGNNVSISNLLLSTKGSAKVEFTLTPITGFAGGNDVNLFADEKEFSIVAPSGQNAPSKLDLADKTSYVNVPLNGFKIKTVAEKKFEADATISVAPIDLIDTANTVKDHGTPYDDFLTVSSYMIDDAEIKETTPNIATVGSYKLSFVVTPAAAAKAVVGTPVVATEYSATALISQKSAFEFNGVDFDMDKNLTYDASKNEYTYSVTLTTTNAITFQQVSEDAFYTDGVTYYNNNAGSGVSSNTFTAAVPGEYIFYALGGPGGDGGLGHANQDPGAPGNGGQVAGKVTLDANQQVIVEVGSKGQAGDKASSMFETGDCGQGGFATSFKMNGGYVLVAGGGGGGGGGAATGTTGGKSVDNSSIETTYNSTANYYNGKPEAKKGNTKQGGDAGKNFRSSSVTAATFTGLSNSDGGAAKIVPNATKKNADAIASQLTSDSGLANVNISVLDISKYFSNVDMATVNSSATTTLVDKQVNTSETISGTSYHYEKTTAKVAKTWTFTFKPADNFLGGYDVPVFDEENPQIVLKHNTTSEIGKVTAGTNAAGVMTDYANVKITDPKVVSAKVAEKQVTYGDTVAETDLFTLTGSYPTDWHKDFVNVTDDTFATLGNTLPVVAKADETFTYKCGVAPKAESATLANVGPAVTATSSTATSKVVISNYPVKQTLTNLTSNYSAATVTAGADLVITLSPKSSSYVLPDTITVTIGDDDIPSAQYSYDKETGVVTIPADIITADVAVVATAKEFKAEKYTFYLVYTYEDAETSENVTEQKQFEFESGTAFDSYTDIKNAMTAAEAKVTETTGYVFVWDWPDGEPLTTMPSQNFWLVGQLEPMSYNLEVVSTFTGGEKNGTVEKDNEKVWYTLTGTITAPAYEGYVLNSTPTSISYNINADFVTAHPTNGATIANYVTFNYTVPTNQFTSVTIKDGSTVSSDVKTASVTGSTIWPSSDVTGYDLTVDVNGTAYTESDFKAYTIKNGDVVTFTYSPQQWSVEMWDVAEDESLGFIDGVYGGIYSGLATKTGYIGSWFYDKDCKEPIITDPQSSAECLYNGGNIKLGVDKIYVTWELDKEAVTHDAIVDDAENAIKDILDGKKLPDDQDKLTDQEKQLIKDIEDARDEALGKLDKATTDAEMDKILADAKDVYDEAVAEDFVNEHASDGNFTAPYDEKNNPVDTENMGRVLSGDSEYEGASQAVKDKIDNLIKSNVSGDDVAYDGYTDMLATAEKLMEDDAKQKVKDFNNDPEAEDKDTKDTLDAIDDILESETLTDSEKKAFIDAIVAEEFVKNYASDNNISDPYDKTKENGVTSENADQILSGETPYSSLTTDQKKLVNDKISTPTSDPAEDTYSNFPAMVEAAKKVVSDDKTQAKTDIAKAAQDAIDDILDGKTLPADEEKLTKEEEQLIKNIEDARDEALGKLDETTTDTEKEIDKIKSNAQNAYDDAVAKDFVNEHASDNNYNAPYDGKNDPVDSENADRVLTGEGEYTGASQAVKDKIDDLIKNNVSGDDVAYDGYTDMLTAAKGEVSSEKTTAAKSIEDTAAAAIAAVKDGKDDKDLTDEEKTLITNIETARDNALTELYKDTTDTTEEINKIKSDAQNAYDDAAAQDFVNEHASDNNFNNPYDEKNDPVDSENADKVLSGETEYNGSSSAVKDKIDALIKNNVTGTDEAYDGYTDMLNAAKKTVSDDKTQAENNIKNAANDAISKVKDGKDDKDLTNEEKQLIKEIEDARDKAIEDLKKSDVDTEKEIDKIVDDVQDKYDDAIAKDFVNEHASDNNFNNPYDEKNDPVDSDNADRVLSGESEYNGSSASVKKKIDDLIKNNVTGTDEAYDGYSDMLADAEKTVSDDKTKAKTDIEKAAQDAIDDILDGKTLPADEDKLTDQEKQLIDEIEKARDKAIEDLKKSDVDTEKEIDKIVDDVQDKYDDAIAKDFVNEHASDNNFNNPYDEKNDPVDGDNFDRVISGESEYDKASESVQNKIDNLIKSNVTGDDVPYDGYKDMLADANESSLKETLDDVEKMIDDMVENGDLTEEEAEWIKEEIEKIAEEALEEPVDPDEVLAAKDKIEDIAADTFIEKYASDNDPSNPYNKGDNKIDTQDKADKVTDGSDVYKSIPDYLKDKINDKISDSNDDGTTDPNAYESYPEMLKDAANKALEEAEKTAKEVLDEMEKRGDITEEEKNTVLDEIQDIIDKIPSPATTDDIINATDKVNDKLAEEFVKTYVSDKDGVYDKDGNPIGKKDAEKVESASDIYDMLPGSVKDKANDLIAKANNDGSSTYPDYPTILETAKDLIKHLEDEAMTTDVVDKSDSSLKDVEGLDDLFNNPKAFDEEDQKIIDEGGKIVYQTVVVKETITEVAATDKTLVEEFLTANGMKPIAYYDIVLIKKTYEYNPISGEYTLISTEYLTDISDGAVEYTFAIPEEYLGKDEYYVIRVHDGKSEVIATAPKGSTEIKVKTDKFSTYVLAYKGEDTDAIADTGDKSLAGALASLLATASAAVATLPKKKKIF